MDCISSQKNVITSKKKIMEHIKPESYPQRAMDNASLQNNNYSSHNQRSSFIPVRSRDNHQGKYALPKYKSCDDNQGTVPQRNFTSVGNASYSIRTPIRRHSLGVDDLSNELSIHNNSNLGQRFQSLGRHTNTAATANTASIAYNVSSSEKIANNQFSFKDHNGHNNQNDKYKFMYRSSNSSPRPYSPPYAESTPHGEKAKDKSFIRKSSLNRLEFVNTNAQSLEGHLHTPFFYSPDKHSTSDANSDHALPPTNSVKRKNSFKVNKREILGKPMKQDFPCSTAEKVLISPTLSPSKSTWWRNRKTYFKNKSYSAGEQDSPDFIDRGDIWKREKVSFSAQETDNKELNNVKQIKKVCLHEPKETFNCEKVDNDCVLNDSPCDIPSQHSPPSPPNDVSLYENVPDSHHHVSPKELDGDLFNSSESTNYSIQTPPFPTKSKEITDSINDVTSEINNLNISVDVNDSIVIENEFSEQPNLVRRKSQEKKGILKNSDDKFSWQPPSILKHRESSEEKDIDLHSILKKSASEDEGSDIRPILKNTSTDDESSNTKPKPILKKRTSFSEECSYACFLSGELKPILKKKTISEGIEDNLKPILKIRRKSEEAAASSVTEFPRPRAYSADRGIKMSNERKSVEDMLSNEKQDICHQ